MRLESAHSRQSFGCFVSQGATEETCSSVEWLHGFATGMHWIKVSSVRYSGKGFACPLIKSSLPGLMPWFFFHCQDEFDPHKSNWLFACLLPGPHEPPLFACLLPGPHEPPLFACLLPGPHEPPLFACLLPGPHEPPLFACLLPGPHEPPLLL